MKNAPAKLKVISVSAVLVRRRRLLRMPRSDCQSVDPERRRQAGQIEIQQHREIAAERPSERDAGRRGDGERRETEEAGLGEIQPCNLPATATNRFHHANLPALRREHGEQQVHDDHTAQGEREESKGRD